MRLGNRERKMGRDLGGGGERGERRLEGAGGHPETGQSRSTWLGEVHTEDSLMEHRQPGRHQIGRCLTFAWALPGGGISVAQNLPNSVPTTF